MKPEFKGAELPADFDSEEIELVRTIQPYTLTSPERIG